MLRAFESILSVVGAGRVETALIADYRGKGIPVKIYEAYKRPDPD